MSPAYPSAVVLCAGGSTRMGRPKALLPLDGVPLVAAHVRSLCPVSRSVAVVVGAHAEGIRTAAMAAGAIAIANPDWATTAMADSLALALRALDVRGPCWVTPVDTPPARLTTLEALLAAGAPAVPVDPADRPGHPVLLDADTVDRVRQRPPEGGLRRLLQTAPRVRVDDPLVAIDFDDPAAWTGYLARR